MNREEEILAWIMGWRPDLNLGKNLPHVELPKVPKEQFPRIKRILGILNHEI